MKTLNLTQLKISIRNKITDYNEMLEGEIRTIGLREKIEKRLITLNKMLETADNHKE